MVWTVNSPISSNTLVSIHFSHQPSQPAFLQTLGYHSGISTLSINLKKDLYALSWWSRNHWAPVLCFYLSHLYPWLSISAFCSDCSQSLCDSLVCPTLPLLEHFCNCRKCNTWLYTSSLAFIQGPKQPFREREREIPQSCLLHLLLLMWPLRWWHQRNTWLC